MTSPEDLVAFAALVARSTVDKAAATIPVGGKVPATVLGPPPSVSSGTMFGTVMVQFDADLPLSNPIEVASLTPTVPTVGQRVMVENAPPWGLFISHSITSVAPPVGSMGFNTSEGPWSPAMDGADPVVPFDCLQMQDRITTDVTDHYFVAAIDGVYHFDAELQVFNDLATAPGAVRASVWTGGTLVTQNQVTMPGTYAHAVLHLHGLVPLRAGDTLEAHLATWVDATGVVEVGVYSHFDTHWVRDWAERLTCSGGGG